MGKGSDQGKSVNPLILALGYALAPLLGFLIDFMWSGPAIGFVGAAVGILSAAFYHARVTGSWVSLYWGMGAATAAVCASWLLGRGPL